ncbi:rhodanese-like domain-containing protein [Roseovarius sp. 2305UL8-3]|uniref:rhodanese-like domain-containing protein n=1 Tax=Roseovarius conchicola TaxID=3121636 RepID=UPI003529B218
MPALFRLMAAPALALSLVLSLPASGVAEPVIASSVAADTLPKGKQTKAALYITAAEAAEVVAARKDVLLIDVRTPEETMFVGHPTAADVNIPFALLAPDHSFDAKKGRYQMKPNPLFAEAMQSYLDTQDASAVLIICRSGGRSARAVDALIEAGVTLPLYSVIDGFEGDKDKAGQRTVNGWKNAGAPWTTKITAGFLQGVD